MIRDNQRVLNQIHVVLDAFVFAGAYVLAWFIKFRWLYEKEDGGSLSPAEYFGALYFIIPGFLALYYWCGLYMSKRYSSVWRELYNIFKAHTIGLGLLMGALYLFKVQNFSRGLVMYFYFLSMLISSIVRLILRYILRSIRRKGFNIKHIILIGYSRACEKYIDRILENPQWGYDVCGILDDHIPAGTMYRGVKVLGTIGNIHIILPENKLDEISISLSLKDYDKLEELVSICEKSGVHTKFIPDYNSVIPSKAYVEDLTGLAVVNIRHVPLTNNFNAFVKRVMDVVGSLLGLILFSPCMLVIAISVKASDGGPVIFSQERIGLHNRKFKMFKFRTMRIQTEEEEKNGWSKKGDERVTKVGKIIRKLSLDELPQLFNVLIGDMSLVGPRPERPQFVDKFKEEIPRYMVKHQVRPGMTGWAQVNGYRGNTSIRKRIEYDLDYIENWTVLFDVKILILTIPKGFINKNAY